MESQGRPPAFLPQPATAADAAEPPDAFVRRVVGLPFSQRLWSAAARWRFVHVIAPFVVVVLLAGAAIGGYRSLGMRPELRRGAAAYSASYPAILVENGEVRVVGDKVIHVVEGNMTILVDPNQTVPLASVTTPQYLVIRKTQILRRDGYKTDTIEVANLAPLLGKGPVRIDSDTLRTFEARWGFALQLGVVALLLIYVLVKESIGCTLYSLAAGGIAFGLRGRALSLNYAACVRVALAASSATVVADGVLALLGRSPSFCLGVAIWPTVITALTLWAIRRMPAIGPR